MLTTNSPMSGMTVIVAQNVKRSSVSRDRNRRDPDISPLYAGLGDLPPALFSVGTRDILLDDTLFMAARWAAAGSTADLAVWPGGCHVFIRFDSALTEQALSRIDAFVENL